MTIFNLKVKCVKYWEVSMANRPSEKKQKQNNPTRSQLVIYLCQPLVFVPLMHAGRDKEVGNVQLLTEVPRHRQCVCGGE